MPDDGELDRPHDVPLDHAVVARIVRRALEIAGPERFDDPSENLGLSRAALVAAAGEVGLPVASVLRAIAVEQLGEPPSARLADRIVGAGMVAVDDEIPGSADEVLHRIDAWLVDGHHLRRDRLRGGRGEWSKRSGVVGLTMRKVRKATGEGQLGAYRQVAAVAEDIGTGSAAVRVTVDRQNDRNLAVAGGAVVAVGGAGGVVLAVTVGPLVLLAAPFVVAGGVGVALTGRRRAQRITVEVERLLEAVADQHGPTRLRSDVAQRVIGRRREPTGRVGAGVESTGEPR